MTKSTPSKSVNQPMMLGVLFLGLIVALVAVARWTDQPLSATPESTPVIAEKEMNIAATLDGAAQITDRDGNLLVAYDSGEAVFISTIARVIAQQRSQKGAAAEGPILLRKRAPNRLTIFDPNTGNETELSSFGKDNVTAFAALLDLPGG